jgi:hypothetical protein
MCSHFSLLTSRFVFRFMFGPAKAGHYVRQCQHGEPEDEHELRSENREG